MANEVTFVLVHGALFTSSGWLMTQSRLQERGFNVALVDVPGRLKDGRDPKDINLTVATEKLCKVVELQSGPVILVGHSQGGALISQATKMCPKKIKGLVFATAVVPADKEVPFAILIQQGEENFGKCVNDKEHLFELKKDGPAGELFLNDIPEAERGPIVAGMVSEPKHIGTVPASVDEALMDKLPKFYIECTKDLILSHPTQLELQKRRKWEKVYTMDTGHCPFLSDPDGFTAKLLDVAERVIEQ